MTVVLVLVVVGCLVVGGIGSVHGNSGDRMVKLAKPNERTRTCMREESQLHFQSDFGAFGPTELCGFEPHYQRPGLTEGLTAYDWLVMGRPYTKLQSDLVTHVFPFAFSIFMRNSPSLLPSRRPRWHSGKRIRPEICKDPSVTGAFAPAGPNTIWKKRISKENYETLAYTALKEFPQSSYITPIFYREVEYNGEFFIEMEDLLHHFNDPSIMDIKMGTRTFLEGEVKNPTLRTDLYEKMIKLDPEAPTDEERDQGAITKLRYMQFRERESSTASQGFRIEAIRMTGEPPNTNLKKVKTKEEVSHFIKKFVSGHEVVIPVLHRRLCDIREKFESISFFKNHEVIGSSILIMYDRDNNAGAWMIDFAKTIPLQDLTVDHRSPWKLGNHEDGYLFGIDRLVEIFGDLEQKLTDEEEQLKPKDEQVSS
ncbi:kinase [Plakobranchus ocellatus]|uniref:Kinase n=1 Tax=Plakobranchus ocellatus TaxID=259542 RepID=A0AAV4C5X4_9GAST|nr:kinase [Plakobranchus ocellatus]